MEFDKIVAIDWSGAKPQYRNIRVAEYLPSKNNVTLVAPPSGGNWTRTIVREQYFSGNSSKTILVGIDFAFAYPYCDEDAYFPGHRETPANVTSLWAEVDRICDGQPDFYGGSFYLSAGAKFAKYLMYQTCTGELYRPRPRQTESNCESAGILPQSVFKCVGPDSVGIGSIAGFRLLHQIELTGAASIWPFCTDPASCGTTVVEIYPALFKKRAGVYRSGNPEAKQLSDALKFYEVDLAPELTGVQGLTGDERDALVSAAGMKSWLSQNGSSAWTPSHQSCAEYEGWIFGI